MRLLGVVSLIALLLAAALSLACRPTQEGELLGTYAVQGTLTDNACAPGLSPFTTLSFQVQLRRDNPSALTWRLDNGGPVPGTVTATGAFQFHSSQVVEAWPADPPNGVRGCSLEQSETISGTLRYEASDGSVADAGTDSGAGDAASGPRPSSFTATNVIQISPVAGGDCTALLLVYGGSFPTLPCTARYALTASRVR